MQISLDFISEDGKLFFFKMPNMKHPLNFKEKNRKTMCIYSFGVSCDG